MYYLLYFPYKSSNHFIIVGTNDDGVIDKLSLVNQNPSNVWGTFEEILQCAEIVDDMNPENFDTWFKGSNYTLIAQSTILPFSTVLSDITTFADLREKYPEHFI